MAIFTSSGNSKCAVDGHPYYPPKPAGDSHRHEDEETSALWDRLRADLANLGAAYGELPEHTLDKTDTCTRCGDWAPLARECRGTAKTPQSPLTPFGEALQSLSHGLAGVATSQPERFETVSFTGIDFEPGMTYVIHAFDKVYEYTHPEPDYDAILLAARKKRKAVTGLCHGKKCDGCCSVPRAGCSRWVSEPVYDVQEDIERAFSRPLSFPKRIGWKPGDCGE